MKITKLVHSCLLIEDVDKTVLIDPGQYSYEANFWRDHLPKSLSYIAITHDHPDHFFPNFVKELVRHYPEATVLATEEIVEKLKSEGISGVTKGNAVVEIRQAPHEPMTWNPVQPQNILLNVLGKVTHPGDNLSFDLSKEVLALPVQGPFASVRNALETALRVRPKTVIPIHDWHWHEEARNVIYQKAYEVLEKESIEFIPIENYQSVEL